MIVGVSTIDIVYSNGYIRSGGFQVNPRYFSQLLQIRFEGETAWSDIGKVTSLGTVGFKRPFKIDYPRIVEVRIWKGEYLGKVMLGGEHYESSSSTPYRTRREEKRIARREKKRLRREKSIEQYKKNMPWVIVIAIISFFLKDTNEFFLIVFGLSVWIGIVATISFVITAIIIASQNK